MAERTDALAAAHRTINEADPETATQAERLRKLYEQVGEDAEVGERAIAEILENGPGAADRLRGTSDAVARVHGIDEGGRRHGSRERMTLTSRDVGSVEDVLGKEL